MKTLFFRLLDVDDKQSALRRLTQDVPSHDQRHCFEVDPLRFAALPRTPFTYWISERLRQVFTEHTSLGQQHFAVRGAYTTDDFRFYRLAWESNESLRARTRDETSAGQSHVLLAKGGGFSPYYTDLYLVVRWRNDGAEAKAYLSAYREGKGWGTDWSACLNGYDYYFRSGLTWPRRPHQKGWFAHVSPGAIFSDGGPMLFCKPEDHWAVCALLNSRPYLTLLHFLMARGTGNSGQTLKYEMGYVNAVPIPALKETDRSVLTNLALKAWAARRSLFTTDETSQAFELPALLQPHAESLAQSVDAAAARINAISAELAHIQSRIDAHATELYGLTEADIVDVDAAVSTSDSDDETGDDVALDTFASVEEESVERGRAALVVELLSWFVGVSFGRFDVRRATRSRQVSEFCDPFEPAPTAAPGTLSRIGTSQEAVDPYPLTTAAILVDDPGHAQDLASAIRSAFAAVFDNSADAWWTDLSATLEPRRGEQIRSWLSGHFFEHHIRRYSRSRRKAPIYWQLATPSAGYSVWLYIHAFSKDTLFRVQNDYAAPKLAHEERRLESLANELRDGATAVQRKALAAQEAFVEELRAFLDEVKRVAPLWNPNLDDGVIINFAPLWRLVPQNKPWQKELKSAWDALGDGKYDWAHLAMHLWPERVVPKCAKDRSLAIAHGLEDVFWVEGTDGKWTARKTPTRSMEELVRERTSPALKSALKSLLEAPAATGSAGRGRGGRRKTAAEGGDV